MAETRNEHAEEIVLEGHLREVGDGYEWASWQLDGESLSSLLPRLDESRWVPMSPDQPDYLVKLFADLGRVRITIERLEEA